MSISSPLAIKFLSVVENGDSFGRKPLSPVTIRTYEHALRRAEQIMDKPFENWEYGDMDTFLVKAEEAGLRGSTAKSIGNILRIMFRWGTEAGLYNKPNPMRGLPKFVAEGSAAPAVPPDKAKELIEAVETLLREKREAASDLALRIPSMGDQFVDKYKFLFEFSYFSGIPLKRLLNIRKDEVTETGVWETTVYGKRESKKFVEVPRDLMERLHQYINEHPATDYVFYGESGLAHGGGINRPLGSTQAYSIFSDARELVGFGDQLTPQGWADAYAKWRQSS